jgi:hypothetical protein
MKMDLGRKMNQGLDGKMSKGLQLRIHNLYPCALKACIPACVKNIFPSIYQTLAFNNFKKTEPDIEMERPPIHFIVQLLELKRNQTQTVQIIEQWTLSVQS